LTFARARLGANKEAPETLKNLRRLNLNMKKP
jgi:hypothetical protein